MTVSSFGNRSTSFETCAGRPAILSSSICHVSSQRPALRWRWPPGSMKRYTYLLELMSTQVLLEALEAVETTASRKDSYALSVEATGKGLAYAACGSQCEDGAPLGRHGYYGALYIRRKWKADYTLLPEKTLRSLRFSSSGGSISRLHEAFVLHLYIQRVLDLYIQPQRYYFSKPISWRWGYNRLIL